MREAVARIFAVVRLPRPTTLSHLSAPSFHTQPHFLSCILPQYTSCFCLILNHHWPMRRLQLSAGLWLAPCRHRASVQLRSAPPRGTDSHTLPGICFLWSEPLPSSNAILPTTGPCACRPLFGLDAPPAHVRLNSGRQVRQSNSLNMNVFRFSSYFMCYQPSRI